MSNLREMRKRISFMGEGHIKELAKVTNVAYIEALNSGDCIYVFIDRWGWPHVRGSVDKDEMAIATFDFNGNVIDDLDECYKSLKEAKLQGDISTFFDSNF